MRLHTGSFFICAFRLWRPLPAPRHDRNLASPGHRLCVRRRVVRRQAFWPQTGRGQTTRTPQWAWWSGSLHERGIRFGTTYLRLSLSVPACSVSEVAAARRGPATCFSSTWRWRWLWRSHGLGRPGRRQWTSRVSRVARRELRRSYLHPGKPRTRREGAIILNTFLRHKAA